MTTTIRDTTLLALDTFRADRDGCLAYLVVEEASRTALAIDRAWTRSTRSSRPWRPARSA